jgi:hypothetical protein
MPNERQGDLFEQPERLHRKLSEEMIAELCKWIGMGLSNLDACRLCNIHEATFYRWLKNGNGARPTRMERKLCESLKKAEAQFKATHVANILKHAKDGAWQASAWMLERKQPKEYAKIDRKESAKEDDTGMLGDILAMMQRHQKEGGDTGGGEEE